METIAWLALFVSVVALLLAAYSIVTTRSDAHALRDDMRASIRGVVDVLEEPKRREFDVHEAKRRKRAEQQRQRDQG